MSMVAQSDAVIPSSSKTHRKYSRSTPRAKYDMTECLPSIGTSKSSISLPHEARLSRAAKSLLKLNATWDKGGREAREAILQEFVENNRGKTGPELERELGHGASLFLTRLTAWLRLTYLLGRNLGLQFRAIAVFISASSGHRYLAEFMEVGGVLTILETLGLPQVKEPDKAEGLRLLFHVCNAGRKYKEFICESYGVRAVADCLAKSRSEITQDYARNLLIQLGEGNPKFLSQVYKSLLSLVTSPTITVTAQQMAGQSLRALLPSIKSVHPSIVEATISLLKSVHVQIQYEGCELLRYLIKRKELQETVLAQLIALLKVPQADRSSHETRSKNQDAHASKLVADDDHPTSSAIYMHQAHAARLLGSIAASSKDLAERMISMQVVNGLLQTIGNVAHPESQKYATDTLLYLAENFEHVANALRSLMGVNFYDVFLSQSDTFYKDLTKEQVRYLRRNTVRIRSKEDGSRPGTEADLQSTDTLASSESLGALNNGSREIASFPEAKGAARNSSAFPAGGASLQDESRKTEAKARLSTDGNAEDSEKSGKRSTTKQTTSQSTAVDLYVPFDIAKTRGSLSGNRFAVATQQNMEEKYGNDLANFRASQKTKSAVATSTNPSPSSPPDTSGEDKTSTRTVVSQAKEIKQFNVRIDPRSSQRYARATNQEIFQNPVGLPASATAEDAEGLMAMVEEENIEDDAGNMEEPEGKEESGGELKGKESDGADGEKSSTELRGINEPISEDGKIDAANDSAGTLIKEAETETKNSTTANALPSEPADFETGRRSSGPPADSTSSSSTENAASSDRVTDNDLAVGDEELERVLSMSELKAPLVPVSFKREVHTPYLDHTILENVISEEEEMEEEDV